MANDDVGTGTPEVTFVAPPGPPRLTPGLAAVLLRILSKAAERGEPGDEIILADRSEALPSRRS